MKTFFYQLISTFFLPPTFPLFILIVGLVLIYRKKYIKRGRRILTFGVILFYLSSTSSFVNLLSKPLETSFPLPDFDNPPPSIGAIVVLTGGHVFTQLRTIRGVRLYFQFNDLPIIFAGGPISKEEGSMTESAWAAQIAERLGVPREQIISEEQSRDTYENAVYTSKILKERNITNFFLVTSGIHMYRAVAVFKKNGFSPIPVPSGYISTMSDEWISFPDSVLPSSGAFHSLFYVLHEYIGLVWYKLRGFI